MSSGLASRGMKAGAAAEGSGFVEVIVVEFGGFLSCCLYRVCCITLSVACAVWVWFVEEIRQSDAFAYCEVM